MNFFDKRFLKRENKIRRNYEIDDRYYSKLEELSKIYDASIPDLVNACLEELIASENINIYESYNTKSLVTRPMFIRESNVIGLEKLNVKYDVTIRKLVNIALNNVLEQKDWFVVSCRNILYIIIYMLPKLQRGICLHQYVKILPNQGLMLPWFNSIFLFKRVS